MRLPFFRSKSDAGAGAERPERGVDDPGALQAARTQARRRLIGALVLLLAAVVGFPLLFETQPRPLPGAVAIDGSGLVIRAEQGARTGSTGATAARATPPPTGTASVAASAGGPVLAAPAAGPSATPPPVAAPKVTPAVTAAAETTESASAPLATASQVVAKAPAKAASMAAAPSTGKALVAAAVTAAAATAVVAAPAASSAGKSAAAKKSDAPASAAKPAPAKPAKVDAAPAAAAAAPATVAAAAASTPAAAPNVRWVVQVGAYNDMERMRQARQKAEKLGFKTYITDVDTPTGKRTRVRLGPFATKKEAEAAAVKVKANGMAANVLSV